MTETPSAEPTTQTTTEVVTASEDETTTESEETTESEAETTTRSRTTTPTGSVTGAPPYRPTGTTITSTSTSTSGGGNDTQTGCPTGFYGCLATHGGGCCRTGRDCDVHDCPVPSTTIISDGATIVILATDAPPAPGGGPATSTCADGWFLCGASAGPVAGCCPTGYDCGTASCFTVQASQTGSVQKEFPKADAASVCGKPAMMMLAGLAAVFACLAVV